MTGFMEPTSPDAPGTILSSKTYRTPAMQERGARRLGAAKDEHALRSRLLDMLERRDVDKFFRHVIVNAALEHAHRERKDGNGMYILRDVVKQLRQSKRILPPPPPVSAETIAAIQADQRNGGQQKRASEMANTQPPAALPDMPEENTAGVIFIGRAPALPVIPDSENLDEVFPRPAVEDPADVLARKAARKAEYETERAAGLAVAEEFENMPATTITGLPAYAMDAKQAVYAIPKHIAKELDIELDKVGLYIHQFYGMSLDLFIKANGPKRAYELAQENISRINAGQNGNGNSPQKAPPSVETKGTAMVAQNTLSTPLVAPSASAGNGNGQVDLKEEIRRKYNSPQRGKDYLMVQGRVLLFRIEHPDWSLETDGIAITDTAAVFKATIRNAEGRIIATGHGRATEAGTKNLGGRFCEKGETAAIGRALALAGYGTDPSLDDADYLADSPIEKVA